MSERTSSLKGFVTVSPSQNPQDEVQEGQRLMIIELGKYNEIGEQLIEIEPQGHRDMYAIGWRPEGICN